MQGKLAKIKFDSDHTDVELAFENAYRDMKNADDLNRELPVHDALHRKYKRGLGTFDAYYNSIPTQQT